MLVYVVVITERSSFYNLWAIGILTNLLNNMLKQILWLLNNTGFGTLLKKNQVIDLVIPSFQSTSV
jgi:hypothetical protein